MSDEFLKRFESERTRTKYVVILKRFDSFLESRNQAFEDFQKQCAESEQHQKYNILQELVYFLSKELSPRSVRNYFDAIFKYLLYSGFEFDYTQRRIRVQFPRITNKRFEGLDRTLIMRLFGLADPRIYLYMRLLAGGGFREAECLQLKPKYFHFFEDPVRVDVVSEIAKFGIERETFIPKQTANLLQDYIRLKNIGNEDFIFVKEYRPSSVYIMDEAFSRLRKKAGLATPDRKKHQHNELKLHSFRAWFITTWSEIGKRDFGHALAGHSKELSVYYRTSKQMRAETYKQFEIHFDF